MRGILIVLGFCLLSTSAPAKERGVQKPYDPNRIICKTDGLIGSRLQEKKTCLTVTQWEEMKRDQRNTVEKVQAFKPVVGG